MILKKKIINFKNLNNTQMSPNNTAFVTDVVRKDVREGMRKEVGYRDAAHETKILKAFVPAEARLRPTTRMRSGMRMCSTPIFSYRVRFINQGINYGYM